MKYRPAYPSKPFENLIAARQWVGTFAHWCLSEHILRRIAQRNDVQWFGLIGSRTKRAQFSHRLLDRGIAPETLAHMVCPIGLAGISGKQPAVIAASVTAQLLGVWEHGARQDRRGVAG